jgi:hypothetical protein
VFFRFGVEAAMTMHRWALTVLTTSAALALGGFAPSLSMPGATALEKSGWTLVTASDDTYVYMRAAAQADTGLRRVWTAYDAAHPLQRDGFTFRSVRSLGEYDCRKRLSRVVEETYHGQPALKGKGWQSPKFVATPWAAPVPESVGAIRMAFACRALSDV